MTIYTNINKFNMLLCVLCGFILSTVYAQDGETVLEDALESFARHQYDHIIELLTALPPSRLPERSQQIMGYELLAQAYFYSGTTDSVKSTLDQLLDLQSNYTVQTPQYPQAYIDLVDQVREDRLEGESKSFLGSTWFWISGAAVTTAAILLLVNKDDPQTQILPEAPDPPN